MLSAKVKAKMSSSELLIQKSPIKSRESLNKLYLDFEESINRLSRKFKVKKVPGQDTVNSHDTSSENCVEILNFI